MSHLDRCQLPTPTRRRVGFVAVCECGKLWVCRRDDSFGLTAYEWKSIELQRKGGVNSE
jgi:hypothetical protein